TSLKAVQLHTHTDLHACQFQRRRELERHGSLQVRTALREGESRRVNSGLSFLEVQFDHDFLGSYPPNLITPTCPVRSYSILEEVIFGDRLDFHLDWFFFGLWPREAQIPEQS